MKCFLIFLFLLFSPNAFSQFAMNGFWSARSFEVKCLDNAPANIKLILNEASFIVPPGVTSIKAWVVGGGGGGAGSLNMDGSSGGGGGAGGMVYHEFPVTPGQSITFTFGIGGAGGNGSASDPLLKNGQEDGSTILNYNSINLTANGGAGGLIDNYSNVATGGSFAGTVGSFGIKGGDSPGVGGDTGGSSGGAIGDILGARNGSSGSNGGLSADFHGLKAIVEACGLSFINNGKMSATNTSNSSDRNNGTHSKGVGCGGGSPGYWGGRGGAGFLGGGGAGSASYLQYNIGGKGGDGFVFLTWTP